ncbi:MAG: ATP synthase F1 subunit delta [Candidatus Magasanikbacteria bacterium CG_4_9_14_0_2_um_filter_42_11]|uniref:ATP synthase F1 subunit delta n=1 Tax=Candidatus Magasanikbacteria bacterium CG_4_9_14_0_2_um_filter_42_11 TaxID=1974643 RepID=A0A2M8FB12_9BACT|nr:MAG: ATP synthase F1 subunit delta [Candidatus Magasanikbacteria bacterium CG10_big_fil_rev_8_21_14_0_10_43_9]PIY92597.1 MAG: ATP synthase F1 subunit delta [Candidatus Magasanikbacteria bacterium CG_4_10_14_0_8_um_filter_42_12]PJC52901.1 MAG: ATP synthase F1 subunit delta [Candidatus Magasanikbacteria bacterium CG_4_9_14_0_2_um_filter_42_11]
MALLPKQYARILFELTDGKSGDDLELSVETFVKFLIEERALSKKEYLMKAFKEYAKLQQGVKKIVITSARELSEKITEEIALIFGKKVEVETKIDTTLIGGIVVRTGDTIFDASVKSQLEQLQRQLT